MCVQGHPNPTAVVHFLPSISIVFSLCWNCALPIISTMSFLLYRQEPRPRLHSCLAFLPTYALLAPCEPVCAKSLHQICGLNLPSSFGFLRSAFTLTEESSACRSKQHVKCSVFLNISEDLARLREYGYVYVFQLLLVFFFQTAPIPIPSAVSAPLLGGCPALSAFQGPHSSSGTG